MLYERGKRENSVVLVVRASLVACFPSNKDISNSLYISILHRKEERRRKREREKKNLNSASHVGLNSVKYLS